VLFLTVLIDEIPRFKKGSRKKEMRRAKKKPVMRVTGFLFPLLETLRKMKSEKVR